MNYGTSYHAWWRSSLLYGVFNVESFSLKLVSKDCFDDFKYCKETTLSTQTLESNCERVNVTETVVQQNAGFFRVMPRQRIPIVRLCDILESES